MQALPAHSVRTLTTAVQYSVPEAMGSSRTQALRIPCEQRVRIKTTEQRDRRRRQSWVADRGRRSKVRTNILVMTSWRGSPIRRSTLVHTGSGLILRVGILVLRAVHHLPRIIFSRRGKAVHHLPLSSAHPRRGLSLPELGPPLSGSRPQHLVAAASLSEGRGKGLVGRGGHRYHEAAAARRNCRQYSVMTAWRPVQFDVHDMLSKWLDVINQRISYVCAFPRPPAPRCMCAQG